MNRYAGTHALQADHGAPRFLVRQRRELFGLFRIRAEGPFAVDVLAASLAFFAKLHSAPARAPRPPLLQPLDRHASALSLPYAPRHAELIGRMPARYPHAPCTRHRARLRTRPSAPAHAPRPHLPLAPIRPTRNGLDCVMFTSSGVSFSSGALRRKWRKGQSGRSDFYVNNNLKGSLGNKSLTLLLFLNDSTYASLNRRALTAR